MLIAMLLEKHSRPAAMQSPDPEKWARAARAPNN
jgi:hypothetical protein